LFLGKPNSIIPHMCPDRSYQIAQEFSAFDRH
jgi:hypothetical protein